MGDGHSDTLDGRLTCQPFDDAKGWLAPARSP